jgi:hypothetical protein
MKSGARVVVIATLLALPAESWGLAMGIDTLLSGSAPAGTSTPWITSYFTDAGNGKVLLRLESTGLSPGEKLKSLYFNLAPTFNPKQLEIRRIGGTLANRTKQRTDRVKAGQAGRFDLGFLWQRKRGLGAGESASYEIGCKKCGGLDASFFDFLSTGGYLTAARFRDGERKLKGLLVGDLLNLDPEIVDPSGGGEDPPGDGKGPGEGQPPGAVGDPEVPVSTPDPATALLLGPALAAIAIRRLRAAVQASASTG